MRRTTYSLLLLAAAVPLAACGDDDGGDGTTIDAPIDSTPPDIDAPPGAACGTAETTISAYPATFEGTVLGDGGDLTVDMGACADERGYFGASGEDHVIELTNLTAGTSYGLTLTTEEDLLMYVTTACTGGEPSTGACLLLVDQSFTNEMGDFVAPAGGSVHLIIDVPDKTDITTGAYTLAIAERASECIGDDGMEPDDTQAEANTIAFPTTGPTMATGSICNVPGTEADWYTFTAPAAGEVRIAATWTNPAADLDFKVYDDAGTELESALAIDFSQEVLVFNAPAAGDYSVELVQFDPQDTATTTAYTFSLAIPNCTTSFDCLLGTAPVCNAGLCEAGPTSCTGDDAADTGATSDDGPAGSTLITAPVIGTPVTVTGSVCGVTGTESDWYRIVVGAGEGITAAVTWTDVAMEDIDVIILDSTGAALGLSFWVNPETVTTSYLPAGTYYINVDRFDDTSAAAHPYNLQVTRTAAQVCTSAADCASEYETQFYRGNCAAGTCQFIAPGTAANGAACDTGDDCMSETCSYIAFESDAQDSVCTTTCTTTANCAAIPGTTCTTGFQTNLCVPSCTTNLECGALTGSGMLDTGLPWNYLTCTTPAGTCGP